MHEFKKIKLSSSLPKQSYMSGQQYDVFRPCKLTMLYNDKTGTIILEHVWCDGEILYPSDLDAETLQKFNDEIIDYIANVYFEFESEQKW